VKPYFRIRAVSLGIMTLFAAKGWQVRG